MIDTLDGLDGLHGAYTYGFAREALGEYRLRAAVETGDLVSFGRGVLLDARRVLDLRTRCAGALLLTGDTGVLVGPTAAALHGCCAIGGFPIHVRVPYAHRIRSRNGLVVHQGAAPDDTTMVDGLKVLSLALAISEALCTAPRRTALACADEAMHPMRPDDRVDFRTSVAAHLATRSDRRGTRQAGMLLSLATGLPESPAQSALLLVLTDAGLPRPTCQHEVRAADGRPRHRLDFAWPALKIAVEYNETSQPTPLDNSGWLIVNADAQDLADPTSLCGHLRTAFATRRCAA
jgi:hypothetical protein